MDAERLSKIEKALEQIAKLQDWRAQQERTFEELRFVLEYEREMIKIDKPKDGKYGLVRRGHVLSGPVPRRIVEHTRWDTARPEDIVGVHAEGEQHPYFFQLPIRPHPGLKPYQSMGYSILEPKGPIHGFKSPKETVA